MVLDIIKPEFDLVVADEAQDLNLNQLAMIQKIVKPSGRVCLVGDDKQAIYGFRGALRNGMEKMTEKLQAAGVKAVRHFYPGVTHEFFGMDAVVADAATAQDIAARDLRMALGIGAATPARRPAAGR